MAPETTRAFYLPHAVVLLLLLLNSFAASASPRGTAPASSAFAGSGLPPAGSSEAAGIPLHASLTPSEALSSASAVPKSAALPSVSPAPSPQKPAKHPSPMTISKGPAAHEPEAPAQPPAMAPASMQRMAATAPLSAQTPKLTPQPSRAASPSPSADTAAHNAAADAAPSEVAQTPSALVAPRAAPPRLLATASTPPPTLADPPSTPQVFPAPASLQARQAPLKVISADPALTAVAGSIAATVTAGGLAKTPEPLRVISPAQAPAHSPRPGITLRAPLAQASRTAPLVQAPPPPQKKPASPASTAPAPSPAELAQAQQRQQAAENMKAAFVMVDRIEAPGYGAVPQEALSITPAPPVPEQPPVPVNVTSKQTKFAVSMLLRISGSGVTPFTLQKQQQLINVFLDATSGNLSASQFTVLLVSSAFSARHRSLLQAPIVALGSSKGTPLKDVADVTVEVSAGTPGHAAAVRNQLAALINGKSYLDMALQRAGLSTWSIKLLTISIVQPSQFGGPLPCQKTFGRWCLDSSGLTIPVVILIISVGAALLVFSIILVIVIREVKKRSGTSGSLEYPKNDSTTTKTHILKYVIGEHANPSPSKA